MPPALMQNMRDWAKSQAKDIKFATKPFKREIDAIPSEYAEKIERAAYREALDLFRAFRAEGTAKIVAAYLAAKG
jgi:fructose-bisphosphate aldolase class II